MRSLIEFGDLTDLNERLRQFPNRAEKAVNKALHTEGVKVIAQEMTNLIPVSKRQKRHAKDSKWYTHQTGNLEFVVKSKGGAANRKGSFGYLVFPDEGRGSKNPVAQNFSGRSLQKSTPKVLQKIHGALDQLIEEGL